MPNVKARREAGRVRDVAVSMVDGGLGYTYEHSHDKAAHGERYDATERNLLAALRSHGFTISKS